MSALYRAAYWILILACAIFISTVMTRMVWKNKFDNIVGAYYSPWIPKQSNLIAKPGDVIQSSVKNISVARPSPNVEIQFSLLFFVKLLSSIYSGVATYRGMWTNERYKVSTNILGKIERRRHSIFFQIPIDLNAQIASSRAPGIFPYNIKTPPNTAIGGINMGNTVLISFGKTKARSTFCSACSATLTDRSIWSACLSELRHSRFVERHSVKVNMLSAMVAMATSEPWLTLVKSPVQARTILNRVQSLMIGAPITEPLW